MKEKSYTFALIPSDASSTARKFPHQVHNYRSVPDAVELDLSHSAMPEFAQLAVGAKCLESVF